MYPYGEELHSEKWSEDRKERRRIPASLDPVSHFGRGWRWVGMGGGEGSTTDLKRTGRKKSRDGSPAVHPLHPDSGCWFLPGFHARKPRFTAAQLRIESTGFGSQIRIRSAHCDCYLCANNKGHITPLVSMTKHLAEDTTQIRIWRHFRWSAFVAMDV